MSVVIVYTRPDRGVTVCRPAPGCLSWLASGGFWAGKGRGWLDDQEERQIAAGHQPWAVRRYMRAMQEGGCTTAEAYEIIRDRDCGHLGSGFEVWNTLELPDRWFRNAWCRSHNGGPIGVSMPKARQIQLKRIAAASRKRGVSLQLSRWRERIRRASSPEELRHIWPNGLTIHG